MPRGHSIDVCAAARAAGRQAAIEVPEQVVQVFEADRQADRARADAGGDQLLVAELAVGRAGRMDHQATWRRRRWPGGSTVAATR